ncbi:MAG TPA: sulfurtransferase TusA family protein [Actinomycetota bacterium]|nr:sulfurtransferase TusA family protein [Actinomycetota bacterium]
MSTTAADIAPTATVTVDARGQSCPGPLVSLAQALKDAERGDLLELLATDPGSRSDVPSWAEISGNELVEATQAEGEFRFLVRKV